MSTTTTKRNEMSIMDPVKGDLKVIWDPDNEEEVKNAKKNFDDMKKKGYLAYKVDEDGDKAELMRRFDKSAEAVILAPAAQGG